MTTDRDLFNSRPLDVHKWSMHPEINAFCYDLWDKEFAAELDRSSGKGKKAKRKLKYQFKTLILDLYVAWKTDPSMCIGVGMSKSAYEANSRYNALHISSLMIGVIKALHHKGYIGLELGVEGAGRVTRIWAEDKLTELFSKARWSLFDISNYAEQEVIILNKKVRTSKKNYDEEADESSPHFKTVAIAYEDDDYAPIVQMREDLKAYNELLSRTFVDIGELDGPVIERLSFNTRQKKYVKRRIQISQQNKFVKRIFYRGDWSLGGRFHGGFWQQIKSEYRRKILINDQPSAEIDYSGLHISLAYALEQQTPPKDPYTVKPMLEGYTATEQRSVVKQLALTAINARSLTAAYQAFRNEQDTGTKQKKLTNNQLQELLEGFIEQNKAIEQYIATDKGVELMAIDGRITARIINYFTNMNIPVLTIHDSYIVPMGYEQQLHEQMDKATEQELKGYRVNLKYEVLTYNQINNQYNLLEDKHLMVEGLNQLSKQSKPIRTEEYKVRLNEWNEWINIASC